MEKLMGLDAIDAMAQRVIEMKPYEMTEPLVVAVLSAIRASVAEARAAAVGAAAPPTDEQVEAAFKASAYGWSSHQFESRVSFREGVEWALGLAAGTASAAGASPDAPEEAARRYPEHDTTGREDFIAGAQWAAGASSSAAVLRDEG